MKIIFDSNVWRKIASPDRFPNDPSILSYRKIRDAIIDRRITPYISETVFTIETIKRKERKEFISRYRPKIVYTEKLENGEVISTSISESNSVHPGNHPILAEHLRDAITIGFRIIRCPRIAGIINPEIEDLRFKLPGVELKAYHDKLFEVGEKIEAMGAGFSHIQLIGEKYDNIWFKGIDKAPEEEWGLIANAMAEWADGDSVAISVAIGCDYMCTLDSASKAGTNSVFSQNNITWLKSDYGFEVITPDLLSNKI